MFRIQDFLVQGLGLGVYCFEASRGFRGFRGVGVERFSFGYQGLRGKGSRFRGSGFRKPCATQNIPHSPGNSCFVGVRGGARYPPSTASCLKGQEPL